MSIKHWIGIALGLVALPGVALSQDTNIVRLDGREVDATRILVKFKEDVNPASRRAFVEAQGMRIRRAYPALNNGVMCLDEPGEGTPANAASAEHRAQALQNRMDALRRSGKFEYVEPDYIVYPTLQPSDEAFQDGTLWGLRNTVRPGVDIGAEQAWNATTGSSNVIVGVIDTGVRYTHEELVTQMWRNPDEIPDNDIDDDNDGYVDNVYGINAAEDTGDPFDLDDHGTHVSGTIGAQANGGGPHVGVAWNVRIMALKFLNPSGRISDAIECLNFAIQEGVLISNNSWGGGGYNQALFDTLVAARDAGHLFIAAAGNAGTDNDLIPSYPSNYEVDNVIAVAALDRNDNLAGFSQYGLETVDLGAPGVEIYSSTAASDTDYSVFQGTSMATPHVSGVAALLLAQFPDATYLELRDRLLSTTEPVLALAGKCVTGGRLNAPNALGGAPDGILEVSITPPSGDALLSPSTQTIVVSVSDFLAVTNATVTGYVTNNGVFLTTLNFDNSGTAPDEVADDNRYTADLEIPALSTSLSMRLEVTAPGKAADLRLINYVPIPLPANDGFVNAQKIPAAGGFFVSSTKNATMEAGEPTRGGPATVDHSLWYNWSPSSTGTALVDPAGSAFDSVIGVYTGNAVNNLTLVAQVNNVGRLKQGYLYFPAVQGTTYRIAVAGTTASQQGLLRLRAAVGAQPDTTPPVVSISGPASGATLETNFVYLTGTSFDPVPNASGVSEISISVNRATVGKVAFGTTDWNAPLYLPQGFNRVEVTAFDHAGNRSAPVAWTLTVIAPVSNDHFNNAIELTEFPGSVAADTASMTKEFGEPNHANNEGGHSAWWTFTAPYDGLLSLSTTNSPFDTLLGLYSGTNVNSLTEVASNDDADGDAGIYGSQLEQAVRSNQTYHIAVDGYAGETGLVELVYSLAPRPVYDLEIAESTGGSVQPDGGLYASNATVTYTATADPGYVFSAWSGVVSSSSNPVTFSVTNSGTLTAVFVQDEYADDFEGGFSSDLDWDITGGTGNVPWFVQTNHASVGLSAARSGIIGNLQTSALKLTFVSDAGNASFDVRVSSEANWDILKFYVNGALKAQWSGEVDWLTHMVPVNAGTNLFEWRYVKDAVGSAGMDAAFIDSLRLPFPEVALALANPAVGSFDIQLTAGVSQTVEIQATTNLVDWSTIDTVQAAPGVTPYVDSDASANTVRYYRAMVPAP